MNVEQVRSFVLTYLEAYQCDIVEKVPTHVTVKLSIDADKELTNRAYYWGFVERTGAPAETMTMTFVFDPPAYQAAKAAKPFTAAGGGAGAPFTPGTGAGAAVIAAPAGVPGAGGTSDSILGRYFGFVPTTVIARVPTDDVTFGSRRLKQLFQSAKLRGRFVRLFEEPHGSDGAAGTEGAAVREEATGRTGGRSAAMPVTGGGSLPRGMAGIAAAPSFETWLLVNFKVELVCDMKRSEIHSLAISLSSGRIREQFYDEVQSRKLTPRLPGNIRLLPDLIPLDEAAARLEAHVEHAVRGYDHTWADRASEQLQLELDRIDGYYGSLLQTADPDQRPEIEAQYENRKGEIDWQYRPRIQVSVINCGFFHFQSEPGL